MNARDRQMPPLLCDWEPGADLARPGAGETRVLRVDLGPLPESDEPERLPHWKVLSEEERARAARFVRPRDGRRFVICRGSLRLIIGQLLDDPPEAVAFRFGPGGKPELAGPRGPGDPPLLRFNVTHSGDLALIAVSLDRELGVDLERIRPISEAARIVESYFTPAEQVQFAALEEPARAAAFLRGWTRKEAILKAKGVGLAGLTTGYETMFATTELTGRFTLASPSPRIQEWLLWEASPREDYFAALAVQDSSSSVPRDLSVNPPANDLSLRGSPGPP